MSNKTITTEEAARVVMDTIDEQLAGVPRDQQGHEFHVQVFENVLRGLAAEGLYDVAAAVMRSGKGVTEERVYNSLMALANANGADESMVFQSVYGLREDL